MLSESLQTDRGVDNKVSNIDFVISDYLCTKNDNNMANICSLVEIIESFDDSPSMILVGFQFINQLTGGFHSSSKQGDFVRIIEGSFKGIEGRVTKITGQKRIIVELPGLCSVATAYVPKAFLLQLEYTE